MKRAVLWGWVVVALPASFVGAVEPPVAQEPVSQTPVAKDSAAPPQETLAARTTTLLRETAVALQSQSIEPAEETAFRDLLAASEKLKGDKTLAPSERDRLRALARVRLRQAAEVLAKQTAKAAAIAKKDAGAKKEGPAKPATLTLPAQTTLAQQLQIPGGGAGAGFMAGAAPGGNAANPAAAELESAKQLMDVITSTIQPESWEEVGGRGVIRYWVLGHALIIRNTSDVHGAVGDVIQQLRK